MAYLTYDRILDRCPNIFAVTCYHVVGGAAQAVATKLVATPAGPTITFSGTNTPGTLVQTR